MKDNKIYKVLRIVFLTLAIISMVFALMKKVGLAAEDSSSSDVVSSFPLPISLSYGITPDQAATLSQLDFDSLINEVNTQRHTNVDTVSLNDWTDSNNYTLVFYRSDWTITANSQNLTNSSSIRFGQGSNEISRAVRYSNGSFDYGYSNIWGSYIYFNTHLSQLPDGSSYLPSNEFITNYPIYSQADSISTSDGFLLFKKILVVV